MTVDLGCPKCLVSRGDDAVGQPCRTQGCDGIIEVRPSYLDLVDVLPEPITCARRYAGDDQREDRWHKFKKIDNRVCSYCGSLHPEDLFRLVKQAAETPESVGYLEAITVEQSDKMYKIYIRQPGVRNAHEGGIKFYTDHLPRDADNGLAVTQEQHREFDQACKLSKLRFDRWMRERFSTQG